MESLKEQKIFYSVYILQRPVENNGFPNGS